LQDFEIHEGCAAAFASLGAILAILLSRDVLYGRVPLYLSFASRSASVQVPVNRIMW
jgi:hypothetical protein